MDAAGGCYTNQINAKRENQILHVLTDMQELWVHTDRKMGMTDTGDSKRGK